MAYMPNAVPTPCCQLLGWTVTVLDLHVKASQMWLWTTEEIIYTSVCLQIYVVFFFSRCVFVVFGTVYVYGVRLIHCIRFATWPLSILLTSKWHRLSQLHLTSGAVDKTSSLIFSAHGKIGNFIFIIIFSRYSDIGQALCLSMPFTSVFCLALYLQITHL